jgi:hypothetical protein
MNAKDFLSRARLLDEQVQSKLMQVESLKSIACRVTTVYGAKPVTRTRNVSGMEDVILSLTEAEEELNGKIDELVSAKLRISTVISRVEDPILQLILERKYLEFQPLTRIGAKLKVTTRWIRELHRRALDEVQRILDEEG